MVFKFPFKVCLLLQCLHNTYFSLFGHVLCFLDEAAAFTKEAVLSIDLAPRLWQNAQYWYVQ